MVASGVSPHRHVGAVVAGGTPGEFALLATESVATAGVFPLPAETLQKCRRTSQIPTAAVATIRYAAER